MRPTEFSDEEIVKAGQQLQAEGRNVTGFALRQKVGGGSAPRLKQVWDEHVSGQAVASVEPIADLPVEVAEQFEAVSKALLEKLQSLVVDLNDKAVKAAERRVIEIVKTAGEQRAAAERELADASSTVDDLDNKLDELKAENESLSNKLNEATATLQGQAVEIAQLQERLKASEAALIDARTQASKWAEAREETARYAGQVEALERQLSALRSTQA